MRPTRLYIKDFMCYDHAYIDFTEFSAALIVGKKEHNDDVSNGVGKTTIFKSIEYVLFNHADIKLEDIIRDDIDSCSITLDFIVDGQEYRVTRTRTRKGTTDLTLFKRTAAQGDEEKVLHSIKSDYYSPISDKKYWEDISGRRSVDTEKDLGKLIKVNIKSFRIFVHFMQHDFGGLTTATPEKRKVILRDALSLLIYAKLEKIAKEKSNQLQKEVDKFSTMLFTLGDPDVAISDLIPKLSKAKDDEAKCLLDQANLEALSTLLNKEINELIAEHMGIESKFSSLIVKQQTFDSDKSRIETSIKEYNTKKSNIIRAAQDIVAEVKQLEETQLKLVQIDFNQIDVQSEQFVSNKEKIAQLNLTIQNDMARCAKLKKPITADGECEECRQPITAQHRKMCQAKLDQELQDRQNNIQDCKKAITSLNAQKVTIQQNITSLNLSKQHLESVNTKIATKKNEIAEKRETHKDYDASLQKFIIELAEKNKEIEQVNEDLKSSPVEEAKELKKKIQSKKDDLTQVSKNISVKNKEIAFTTSNKSVLEQAISIKAEEKRKKIDYSKTLKELETKLAKYPNVIKAYSSTGIPNLIIQNVLDDLQVESNNLLSQLKPGIQLSFFVEKTKGDGTEADTLDINYSVNGKKRYYEQLSGAMQLAVNFSLKLGLSFLLQKMAGVEIKFLLLDEIDQSLDKASVNSFTDIVKFFQKDYTILVITHNDRLKDKFSNAILVEQDINMVSCARAVSSW